jgi:Ca2+-binding EF-hand superfamily protein
VFCIPLYALYRYRIGQQERRIKDKFIRGIAKNMSIAPSAGAISRDKLVEEFQRIDKDKGGTIEKAELKDWIDEGKLGTISDADFNALWSALDRDGSGNIDFMEFCTFLSGCSEAFDNVYDEQQKM